MRKFSQWVYCWYEENTFSSLELHDNVPSYSDEEVVEKIRSCTDLYEEDESEIEPALKDMLTPDEKVSYGVYDTTDYDYIEDFDDLGMDIPGYRDV